jgi:hypothetical protein
MNAPQRLKPKFPKSYRRPKGLLHPVVRYSRAKNSLALILALLVIWGTAAAQQKKLPPDYEKKREAIRSFESGVVPLFAVGDLNEDGKVDQEDLKLLRAYVAHPGGTGISCLAAADLDDNGAISAKDVTVLEQILAKGAVVAPALSSHSRLGCDFKNFFIAARPQGIPGGTVPIHFLDPRFTTQNSSVALVAGPAIVAKESSAYVVQVAKNTPGGSIITVSITLANSQKYFYSFGIAPAP